MLRVYSAIVKSGNVVFTPPGVPEDRVQYLRDAFDKIMQMPAFLTEAKTNWKIWTEPTKGADLDKDMKSLADIKESEVATFKQLVAKYLK